ncbi:uncharacterized protein LOC129245300 [Anastrepha obliqua]|uniref:uncharacterized protein LOC129245300 n=1 Tax=Anastrepha obliqua TaxID=95512 RepID=UPI0024090F19|nr:uncharacterized protein LOC129245300 [Anastrepha obliqua]
MNADRSFSHQRRPPDVEEALSSMLWTPYERTTNDSSSEEDERRERAKRLRKSHSSYEHRITCEPFTSTYFDDDDDDDNELVPSGALTTSTPANVANTLQSTPFVPFPNFFYNNDASGSSHRDPISIDQSNHKRAEKHSDGGFRYSYPYYGNISSLHKWWSPSISTKEPPSYESLYANDSAALVAPEVYDTKLRGFKTEAQRDNYTGVEDCNTQRDAAFSSKGEGTLQPLGQINLEVESHIELENCNNNVSAAKHEHSNEPRELATMRLCDEMRPTNGRSQQTEEYNNKINNNNNHDDEDDDGSREKNQLKQQHNPHMQLECTTTSSQATAMARAITTAIAGVTDKSIKGVERAETISHEGEEVSQLVSCIGRSQNPFSTSHLRTSGVNHQNSNNNNNNNNDDSLLRPIPMRGGGSNNERRMNTAAINTLTNLFAAAWSDKATTAERAPGSHWESDYAEQRTLPPVVGAVTIIQSATCSFDGRVSARQPRSSLVALPSYSHLWKKTLGGVRTKVKRVTRPSSENLHVSIAAPLDTLTPNKCLGELERLYAEFRASESALVAARSDAGEGNKSSHRRRNSHHSCGQSDSGGSGSNCDYDCELLNANKCVTAKITDSASNMRLNIPAAASTPLTSAPSELQVHTIKVLPASSTSSVFVTSLDCAATGCLTSNGRAQSGSVSSDDRCSNLLHETKNSNGDCSNNVENQEINNDDVVGAIGNDSRSNNAMVAVLASSTVRSQPSLTIHVNSDNSDQNNNNNCTNNKNNESYNNRRNNCSDNDCVAVDAATPNVNVGNQQKNIVKSNGVSIVNCNYSSVYTISNSNDNNNSESMLSTNMAITTTTTPVSSVSVNKSVSEVSPLPNVFCVVKKNGSSNSVAVDGSAAKNGSNGNGFNTVNVADSVNIISLSAQSPSTQVRAQQASNTSSSVPLTRSALSTQTDVESRPAISAMCVAAPQQPRRFTSTECQTDEISSVQLRTDRAPVSPISNRAQRRRDRRERRQLLQHLSASYPHPHQLHMASPLRRPQDRHSMPPGPVPIAVHLPANLQHSAGSATTTIPGAMSALLRPMLPDLIHRHFPPPYSALPLSGCATTAVTSSPPPPMIGPAPPPGTTLLTPVISTVPMPGGAPTVVSDGRFTLPLPIIRRSPSERSGKGCCGQWFAGPPLRALIAVVALGGVACALGGAALGATGLAGPPNSHLTAALLMIGVGVVLVTVSGAAWRMTAPGGPPCLGLGSAVDLGRCGRRPCGRGGGNTHGLLYPEFQHRPPPPSYQASMQEYRLRLLLLDRDRQNGVVRGNSPPPTYRSYAGSLLRAPLTTTLRRNGATGSIAGTSEYSLPPSYRSRNTTPATIRSEHSVETAPSDRLLANEDIPEPSNTQPALNNHSDSTSVRSLSERPSGSTATVSTTLSKAFQHLKHPRPNQLRTSAIVEIEATNSRQSQSSSKSNEFDKRAENAKDASPTSQKELVTIVTISKSDSQADKNPSSSGEHIEILAHL